MKIRAVGIGSLLVVRYVHLYRTPRVLRMGVAQSLMLERLRRRRRMIVCPFACRRVHEYLPADVKRMTATGATQAEQGAVVEPVDRTWPSDLPIDVIERKRLERTVPVFIESVVGNYLDIWI